MTIDRKRMMAVLEEGPAAGVLLLEGYLDGVSTRSVNQDSYYSDLYARLINDLVEMIDFLDPGDDVRPRPAGPPVALANEPPSAGEFEDAVRLAEIREKLEPFAKLAVVRRDDANDAVSDIKWDEVTGETVRVSLRHVRDLLRAANLFTDEMLPSLPPNLETDAAKPAEDQTPPPAGATDEAAGETAADIETADDTQADQAQAPAPTGPAAEAAEDPQTTDASAANPSCISRRGHYWTVYNIDVAPPGVREQFDDPDIAYVEFCRRCLASRPYQAVAPDEYPF